MTLDVSVVLCAYSDDRWNDLVGAIESVKRQTAPPNEIILVIDHNTRLLEQARSTFAGVVIIENSGPRGLSNARNSGIAAAKGTLLAFMDDDAIAAPDWLERIIARCKDANVMGAGGTIEPVWLEKRPAWFPEEFNWVVGCTHSGMPKTTAPIRNPFGANMALKREVFDTVGGFTTGIGRVKALPLGCEETELCIRAHQRWSERVILFEPHARVQHRVPANRATWKYFWSRCYAEGLSKALVARLVGTSEGLASEREYTVRTLPRGVVRGFADALFRRDGSGLLRAFAIVSGLIVTTVGYVVGTLSSLSPPLLSGEGGIEFKPILVLEIEIGKPLGNLSNAGGYERAWALVRLHSQPLGAAELRLAENGLAADEIARQVWIALSREINAHLEQDGLVPITALVSSGVESANTPPCIRTRETLLTDPPLASIVIATRDRAASLERCLDSLLKSSHRNFEIIVVDNAPSTNATAKLIGTRYAGANNIRYVREDRAGLAVAHNRGLMEVKSKIVAFTDDDVAADPNWLAEIARGFQVGENVACVTGMIFPAELETPAQLWVEQYGFGKGFKQKIFDLRENRPASPLFPYTAGWFGSGANMAFKTSVLREMGGFDPVMGTGTPAMGGDDLAAFFQTIMRGHQLVYQPAAIIHHTHRRDYAGLQKQAYAYGVGLTAYLTRSVVNNPALIFDLTLKIPRGLVYASRLRSQSSHYPQELRTIERKGMFYGPLAYLRSRWQFRKPKKKVHLQIQTPTAIPMVRAPHTDVLQ